MVKNRFIRKGEEAMSDGNNKGTVEHPKSQIAIMENSHQAIIDYSRVKGISFYEASQVLIFNELRCIHWHYDAQLAMRK